MEARGTSPAFAVGPDEAPELARLFEREGPFITVTLPTQPDIDNAAQRSLQQWRPVRDELADAGAQAGALDAIEALVPDAHLDGPSLMAVVDGSEVVVSRAGSEVAARAADGVAATVEALNAAAGDVLLVHDDPDDRRQVWFSPDGPLVALEPGTLDDYGLDQPRQGRLVDALIRAAFPHGRPGADRAFDSGG